MTKPNKAIRDKIPEIIKKSGRIPKYKTLNNKEFLVEMEKKLNEEVSEYQESKSGEELVDILEVVFKIAELRGINKNELEEIRIKKVKEKGSFSANLFLED